MRVIHVIFLFKKDYIAPQKYSRNHSGRASLPIEMQDHDRLVQDQGVEAGFAFRVSISSAKVTAKLRRRFRVIIRSMA